jgi:3-dehydroquinate dehydratase / shikimate dehydrogenase
MARTCLSLTGSTLAENAAAASEFRRYIDVLELRADFLSSEELSSLAGFPSLVDVPVILTVRRKQDGGFWDGTEGERRTLLERGLSGSYSYVDFEIDFDDEMLRRNCLQKGITVIRSLHQFSGVPENWKTVIDELSRREEEIPKYAAKPNCTDDLIKLLEAADAVKRRRSIVLGIGPFGFSTRVLAEKMGNFITFTSPPGRSAAEGHLDPESLHKIYRYGDINASTAVFGIIGNPVLHTKSPRIHNRGFDLLGIDAVYVPFHIDNLDSFFTAAQWFDVNGVSVTIPYKETIIPYLSETSDEIAATGACNTVKWVPAEKPRLRGENFDSAGFLTPLSRVLNGRRALEGMRAAVIGAGGAARSAVYALTESGAKVAIFNRSEDRAARLAEEFGCMYGKLTDTEKIADYRDVIVQATSVGMEHSPGNPIEQYDFRGDEIAYDLIYNPPRTQFLCKAKVAGCTVINGEQMLFAQAKEQFRFFTGRDYPGDISIAELL